MPQSPWTWRFIALLVVLGSGAIHIAYLCGNPLDLAPDEAHYWHWSTQLDASYYSKGPATAFLIRASCELFGDLSRSICGTELIAVRLPAVFCGSLLLIALYVLTLQCFRRELLATLVVTAALAMPAFSLGRTLMTIDVPYACCWGWALVLGHRVLRTNSICIWLILGLVIGVGMLAKYTMVLWLASFGLLLLWRSDLRQLLKQPGPWCMALVAAICCVPIVWWNTKTGWVSLWHMGNHAGVINDDKPLFIVHGPLLYLGGQFGLLFGFWFVVWTAAMIAGRPTKEPDRDRNYLWFLSVPQFLFFGLFSFKTDIMLNWPITAYLSGMVLAAPWLLDRLSDLRTWKSRWYFGWSAGAAGLGLIIVLLLHHSAWVRPVLARLAGPPTATNALPIRRYDPTCRLRGWRHLGREVDVVRDELRRGGIEPIVAASRWTTASELAFYCKGHPTVYSLGSALWDRQSQFDLWRPNPIADPAEFLGATFIFVDVGIVPPPIVAAFDRVEKTRKVHYSEDGVPISIWDITVCRGFRGFAQIPKPHY